MKMKRKTAAVRRKAAATPKPQAVEEVVPTEFKRFVAGWDTLYEMAWHHRYSWARMTIEGAHLKRLLKSTGMTAEALLAVAQGAWNRREQFWCKQASSITGFCTRFNEIAAELQPAGPRKGVGHADW